MNAEDSDSVMVRQCYHSTTSENAPIDFPWPLFLWSHHEKVQNDVLLPQTLARLPSGTHVAKRKKGDEEVKERRGVKRRGEEEEIGPDVPRQIR